MCKLLPRETPTFNRFGAVHYSSGKCPFLLITQTRHRDAHDYRGLSLNTDYEGNYSFVLEDPSAPLCAGVHKYRRKRRSVREKTADDEINVVLRVVRIPDEVIGVILIAAPIPITGYWTGLDWDYRFG